jgi:ankyrin repeat protein
MPKTAILQEVTFEISEGPYKGFQLGTYDNIVETANYMQTLLKREELAHWQELAKLNKLSPTQLQALQAAMEREEALSNPSATSSYKKIKEFAFPYNEYIRNAPIIGPSKVRLGKPRSKAIDVGPIMLKMLLEVLTSDQVSIESQQKIQSSQDIKNDIIDEFYHLLSLNFKPWEARKGEILRKYSNIFNQLVSLGARFDYLRTTPDKIGRFNDLIEYAFDGHSLTIGFLNRSSITTSSSFVMSSTSDTTGISFSNLRTDIELTVPKGADINTPFYYSPECGSHLQIYLANEFPEPAEFIAFLESMRRSDKPNTQFDYARPDGFGNTPLLLAILTRNQKAITALLALYRDKKIDVGINAPDAQGRSPLLIASALGLTEVVKGLKALGANTMVEDKQGRGLEYYSCLSDKKLFQMLKFYVHPLRCDNEDTQTGKHSYLYSNDEIYSPLCFYEEGEDIQTGEAQRKHLVVLSNCSPHKERLERVVAHLESQAQIGDAKAIKLLPYVIRQIDKIKGQKSFLALCKEGQPAVQEQLKEDLEFIHKRKKEHLEQKYKAKNEKTLRKSALLGDVETVTALLKEGVDPNAQDRIQRTALHYAVGRFEEVKAEINAKATSTLEPVSEATINERSLSALNNHHLVVKALFEHSMLKVNKEAKNVSSHTAQEMLENDLDMKNGSENRFTRAEATRCLEVFFKNSGENSSKGNHESENEDAMEPLSIVI